MKGPPRKGLFPVFLLLQVILQSSFNTLADTSTNGGGRGTSTNRLPFNRDHKEYDTTRTSSGSDDDDSVESFKRNDDFLSPGYLDQNEAREQQKVDWHDTTNTISSSSSSSSGSNILEQGHLSAATVTPTATPTFASSALSSSNNNGHGNRGNISNRANNNNKLISLDLAGEVHTHVCSPYPHDSIPSLRSLSTSQGRITTPLFYWNRRRQHHKSIMKDPSLHHGVGSNLLLPSVHIGSQYDFKRVWWGVTRFMTTLSWGGNHDSENKRQSMVTKVCGEVGMLYPNDYSLEVGIKFPRKEVDNVQGTISMAPHAPNMDPMLSIKYNTLDRGLKGLLGHSAIVAARVCPHRRLGVVFKGVIAGLGHGIDAVQQGLNRDNISSSYFQDRIPQEKTQWSEGSWLPDIKMTAGGKVIAKSDIGLGRGYRSWADGGCDDNRVCIRFMASRQLNWNIIGILQGSGADAGGNEIEDGNDTVLRLEIGAAVRDGTYTSIAAEASIEKLPQTLRCILTQEQIFTFQ